MAKTKRPRAAPRRPPPIKPAEFIARHPVFRLDEFVQAHTASGRSPQTSAALLRYHVATGRIRSLRRGLYAAAGWVDPWVLGSRLSGDAVIAYDGALSFHGLTGLGHGLSFLTRERVSRFVFNEVVYQPVTVPEVLVSRFDWGGGLIKAERAGQPLTVTNRERTFVDLLDRLDLFPPIGAPLAADEEEPKDYVELWRCFSGAGALDSELMVRYAQLLENRLVSARLGFFLEHRRGADLRPLRLLERRVPRSPAYFDRRNRAKGGVFLGRWKLIVPQALLKTMTD